MKLMLSPERNVYNWPIEAVRSRGGIAKACVHGLYKAPSINEWTPCGSTNLSATADLINIFATTLKLNINGPMYSHSQDRNGEANREGPERKFGLHMDHETHLFGQISYIFNYSRRVKVMVSS